MKPGLDPSVPLEEDSVVTVAAGDTVVAVGAGREPRALCALGATTSPSNGVGTENLSKRGTALFFRKGILSQHEHDPHAIPCK